MHRKGTEMQHGEEVTRQVPAEISVAIDFTRSVISPSPASSRGKQGKRKSSRHVESGDKDAKLRYNLR